MTMHGASLPRLAPVLALFTVLALPTCSRESKLGLSAAGSAAPAPDSTRVVTGHGSLRREPPGPPRGQGDDGGGHQAIALAVLHRGERVTLLETGGEWSRVRTSSGSEGWTRSASLLPAAEAQEATVLGVAFAFDRPDLLAMNAKRRIEPGTLLLVRNARDLFTEVDAGPGPTFWILTDRLSTQPADVAAARLVDKARWLSRNGRRPEALEVLALLRQTLPGSPLAGPLAIELGEEPPAPSLPASPPEPRSP